jgi:predicted nuclease of restriction endonuclease-like (RecB) superfamily
MNNTSAQSKRPRAPQAAKRSRAKALPALAPAPRPPASALPAEPAFAEVVSLITHARGQTYRAINTALIDLYWRVGEYISQKLAAAEWGEGVVRQLADYIAKTQPDIHGFSRPNLFRMVRFYDAYQADTKVSTLLRQLPWSHNTAILSRCKTIEERAFYLKLATREKWSFRELERQLSGALFERAILAPPKASPLAKQLYPDATNIFKDTCLFDFLDLPQPHNERDLHRALVEKLRQFLTELGRDFCYIGSEYPIQVGGRDFRPDLLFFNRALNCLVDFEMKTDESQPEYLGKLEFYLEALDRDHKKPHERPSIGVLLCATKDTEVVEYALNRALSPALIAEYQTKLPDKKFLQAKLHEFYQLTTSAATPLP